MSKRVTHRHKKTKGGNTATTTTMPTHAPWQAKPYPKDAIVIHKDVVYKSKWNTDKNDAPFDYTRYGGRDLGLSWHVVPSQTRARFDHKTT
jgi:hypothetical protein